MTLTSLSRSLHYKDSKNEPCVHSVSWINRWNLTKLAQVLHWDGGKKWLDFSDLDLIFKATLALCGGYLISIAYWHFIHFLSLFLLCELSLFSVWNAVKVYRQWVPHGHNSSYSFPLIVLKLCICFLHGMKICLWFWNNTSIIFFSLFLLCELSLCFWHEMLSKCIDSGYIVGATPLTFFHGKFWNFADVEDVHAVWI